MPTLVLLADNGTEESAHPLLTDATTFIGSSVGGANGLCVQREGVAPVHCRIETEGQGYSIVNTCSGGTSVNGTKVARAPLKDADIVGIGTIKMRFSTSAGISTPPVVPDAPRIPAESRAKESSKPLVLQRTKSCPFCGETILVGAKQCKHCGESLDGSSRAALQPSSDKELIAELQAEYWQLQSQRSRNNSLAIVFGVLAILFQFLFFKALAVRQAQYLAPPTSIEHHMAPPANVAVVELTILYLLTSALWCFLFVYVAKHKGHKALWGLGFLQFFPLLFILSRKDRVKDRMIEIKATMEAVKKTAAELRREYRLLNAQRRRNNTLSFVFGVPGIIAYLWWVWLLIRAKGPIIVLLFNPGTLTGLIGWATIILLGIGIAFFLKYKGRHPAWCLIVVFIVLFMCPGALILLAIEDLNKRRLAEIEVGLRAKDERV